MIGIFIEIEIGVKTANLAATAEHLDRQVAGSKAVGFDPTRAL